MRRVMAALKRGPKSVAYWRKRSNAHKKRVAKRRKAKIAKLNKADRAVHEALRSKVSLVLKRTPLTKALATLCDKKTVKLLLHASAKKLLAQGDPRVAWKGNKPLRKAIDDVANRQTAITRALGRAQTAQLSLARAADGATELGANVLDAVGRNDENAIGIFATKAELQLEAAFTAFNQRYEGRALFSGDETYQKALADSETLLNDVRAIFAGAADAAQLEADLDAAKARAAAQSRTDHPHA